MSDGPGQLRHLSTMAAQADPVWLSIALTSIGGVLLLGLALTYVMRRRDKAPPPPASPAHRRAIEDLLSDAEELSGRLAANLDAKASRLERLIAQADERLARLERAPMMEARARADRLSHDPSAPEPSGPLNRRIYDLADRGLPPVEIARQLSQQVGQVELILNLRRD